MLWHSLPRLVAEVPVGQEVKLKVLREGKTRTVSVMVGELKDETPEAKAEAPEQGQLGLSLQPLTPDLAKQLGIASNKGLVITDVDSGSPAEEAGLKRGDVILQAANKPLASLEQFGARWPSSSRARGSCSWCSARRAPSSWSSRLPAKSRRWLDTGGAGPGLPGSFFHNPGGLLYTKPMEITLAAPAKVNLHLQILGRRPSGYHELSTLMQPLAWPTS